MPGRGSLEVMVVAMSPSMPPHMSSHPMIDMLYCSTGAMSSCELGLIAMLR